MTMHYPIKNFYLALPMHRAWGYIHSDSWKASHVLIRKIKQRISDRFHKCSSWSDVECDSFSLVLREEWIGSFLAVKSKIVIPPTPFLQDFDLSFLRLRFFIDGKSTPPLHFQFRGSWRPVYCNNEALSRNGSGPRNAIDFFEKKKQRMCSYIFVELLSISQDGAFGTFRSAVICRTKCCVKKLVCVDQDMVKNFRFSPASISFVAAFCLVSIRVDGDDSRRKRSFKPRAKPLNTH
mmetsp:Transcript_19412/g.41473  ORF Transcript_19412/g.41473 Transcript_19412/m.41473 type:complete len:236 (-) Transcript_19412:332-1039(-)